MLDTHRRNHDKLVAQICANQLKIQTKKDVLSLSVRARSLPSFEGMDTENRLMGTFFLFFDYRYSDYRVCVEIFHFVPIFSISPRSWELFPGSWRKEHAREFGSPIKLISQHFPSKQARNQLLHSCVFQLNLHMNNLIIMFL